MMNRLRRKATEVDPDPEAPMVFAARHAGWFAYQPDDAGGQAACPILVDTSQVTVKSTAVYPAVESRWVGPKGAGPTQAGAKWITVVTLEGPGYDIHVLDVHYTASWTRTKAYLGAKEWNARRKHVRDHNTAVMRVAARLSQTGVVVLCGDLNGTLKDDLVKVLQRFGFTGWTTVGTHGARPIDHVLVYATAWVSRVVDAGRRVLKVGNSDHRTPIAELTFHRDTPAKR